jgi:hypothetical protein
VKFASETYYKLLSRTLTLDGEKAPIELRGEDIVLCSEIVFRSGSRGRGRYARLLHQRDDETLVLFHRISGHGRGAGTWEELNPMMALAMTGEIPTL